MSFDEHSREELNAYLDGELAAAERSRVEERLASDPTFHQELRRLERAWNLLDRLEQTPVNADFTRSTMELVTIAAAEDLEEERRQAPQRTLRKRAILLGVTFAAGLVGYAAGKFLWPDHNDTLLKDLPVIQNVDQYQQAGSIDFLKKLDSEKIFAEEVEHAD